MKSGPGARARSPAPRRRPDLLRRSPLRASSASPAPRSGSTSRRCAALGYKIEATPGDGYRLVGVPDRLYPEEILAGPRRPAGWPGTSATSTTDRLDQPRGPRARPRRRGPRHRRGRRGADRGARPPRALLLLAALPEPLHLDRAAPRAHHRRRPRPGSSPPPSPSPRRSRRRVARPGRGRDQVAQRRAARRAQDLGDPDGARRRGDARRLPGARHRRQPERRPRRPSRRSSGTWPPAWRATAGRRVDRVAFARRLYAGLERSLDRCASAGFEACGPRFDARFRMAGRRLRVLELDGRARSAASRSASTPTGRCA